MKPKPVRKPMPLSTQYVVLTVFILSCCAVCCGLAAVADRLLWPCK